MLSKIGRFAWVALSISQACGRAADPHFNPPLITLNGIITNTSIPTPPEVRVALVWRKKDPEGNILRVAQELGVRADFPVRFQLRIDSLPPVDAINIRTMPDGTVDPTFHYATGSLIVYEDVNGNGTLDLLPTDATGAIDRVLGIPERLSVFYVETPTPRSGSGSQRGFNLRREPPVVDPSPGCSICAPTAVGTQQFLPLSTEIQVALTAAPELSREMCARVPPTQETACGGPFPGSVPAEAQVTCDPAGTGYVFKLCHPTQLCRSAACDYGCAQRSLSDPIPAGWPCTPF